MDAFRPLLFFSNICGLGPYAVFRNGKLQHDRKRFLWAFAVLGILCGLQLLVLLDFSGTTSLANSEVADLMDTYGFMITCLGGFLAHCILSSDLLVLWNRIIEIHPKITATSPNIWCDIFGGCVYEIAFTVLSIFIEPAKYLSFFYYSLETLSYVGMELTNYVIFMQFNHLVLACWRSFNALNRKLCKLLIRVRLQPSHTKVQSRLLLKKLSAEHAEIVSVCRMINRVFAVQNLLSVALIFIELTYACYSGIFTWMEDFSPTVVTDTLLWAGYFLYKLLMMLTVCSLTTHASKETERLLHKISFRTDDAAHEVVEYFTLQLIHDNARFDAHGFFPLNFTLIYSMISSVTGYLIILVQFSNFHFRVGTNHTINETGKIFFNSV